MRRRDVGLVRISLMSADLIDAAPVRRRPRAPLIAVDGPEIAVAVRPFVPDADPVVLQVLDVGVPLQEPQELVNDGFEVQLLGGEHGKTSAKIEVRLIAEHAERSGARAVALGVAVVADMVQEIEILPHSFFPRGRPKPLIPQTAGGKGAEPF